MNDEKRGPGRPPKKPTGGEASSSKPRGSSLAEELRSEREAVLFSDDDSGSDKNALIEEYTLPYTGIFYLEATRYAGTDNPNTAGSFTLVLAQRMDR